MGVSEQQVKFVALNWARLHLNTGDFVKYEHSLRKGLTQLLLKQLGCVLYPRKDAVLRRHTLRVTAATVSEDGEHLYTGSEDNSLIHWSLTRFAFIQQWDAHPYPVRCLASHSGRVVSGSRDPSIRVWDAHTHQLERILYGHSHSVNSVEFDQSGYYLISSSDDHTIRMWSLLTGACQRVFSGHSMSVRSALVIGSELVSGSDDCSIKIWNFRERRKVITVDMQEEIAQPRLTLNCDRTRLLSYSAVGISVWEWPGMFKANTIQFSVQSACFHPSHPCLLAAASEVSRGSTIEVFDVTNGRSVCTLNGHTRAVNHLCFTPDGSRLISVSDDRTVRVWNIQPTLPEI